MSNELTVTNFQLPTLPDPEIAREMAEQMDGVQVAYPRVKIPAGGGLAFELPGASSDAPEVAQTITGVIVAHHCANAMWTSDDVSNNPPDCFAPDGKRGVGAPGGECCECRLNEFGSGEGGKGKKCKNMRYLYILRSGDALPLLLSLPPTSLKGFNDYISSLSSRNILAQTVVTKIGLKKVKGPSADYSVATFRMDGPLSPDIAAEARAYAKSLRAQLAGMPVGAENLLL